MQHEPMRSPGLSRVVVGTRQRPAELMRSAYHRRCIVRCPSFRIAADTQPLAHRKLMTGSRDTFYGR